MTPELADAIRASAGRLGVSPVDLGTVISYETAGTFDPWKAGPTTQWGEHRGLIQWGGPQRQRYGVYQGMPVADQMQAAERYLTDAGVRPGMGLLDIYSAVNAGRVGRYNASDANNGGAPGTVADKVNNQMAGHRARAEALLGPAGAAGAAVAPQPQSSPAASPAQPAPSGLLAALVAAPLEPSEADRAAAEQKIMGLLAQATGANEQPQQMGLLADDIGMARAPQFQIKKYKARRRA